MSQWRFSAEVTTLLPTITQQLINNRHLESRFKSNKNKAKYDWANFKSPLLSSAF